jgi:hypothetical protein
MAQDPKYSAKDWISAGGVLGAMILLARLTRLPLATVLGLLPFLLPYLRRAEKEQQAQAPQHGTMTRDEAALILGIETSANAADIKDAHRRLIQKNHPDQGGSDYLAAKINQARDVMMGKR